MSFPDFRIPIGEGIVFVQLKLRRSRQVLGFLLLSLLSVGFIPSSFRDFRNLIFEGLVFVQFKLRRSRQVFRVSSPKVIVLVWNPRVHSLELSGFVREL